MCVTTIVFFFAFFIIYQVMTVVGGMARQKQSRLLKHLPHIIVATPGRLWELIEEVIFQYCELKEKKKLLHHVRLVQGSY